MQAITERGMIFESFYRDERPSVLRAVVFALEDRDLAVECVDEAMTRAYERWDSVSQMANPSGWVFRVAVNFGHTRRRRRLLERTKPPLRDVDRPDIEGVSDPALARALLRLPLDQRTVVVLRFHLDWSIDQVADALEISPGTVKSRLHRGLRRLESLLKKEAA